ncbi:MAG TPA: surface-adhesin E family protein [Rhodothermia bacterium]|nr:surface-adhesin E family protein [Rhodothermia bacterium]
MKTLTMVALACLISTAAPADTQKEHLHKRLLARLDPAEWQPLIDHVADDGSKGVVISISAKRRPVEIGKNVYRVWTRIDSHPAQTVADKKFDYVVRYGEYDCSDARERYGAFFYYRADGTYIDQTEVVEPGWSIIPPDSFPERFHTKACEYIDAATK